METPRHRRASRSPTDHGCIANAEHDGRRSKGGLDRGDSSGCGRAGDRREARFSLFLNRTTPEKASLAVGRSREELVGTSAQEGSQLEANKRHSRDLIHRPSQGKTIPEELVFPTLDRSRWHEQYIAPVPGRGEVTAVAVGRRDIHPPGAQIVENARLASVLAQPVQYRERVMGILGHDLRNAVRAILSIATMEMGSQGERTTFAVSLPFAPDGGGAP